MLLTYLSAVVIEKAPWVASISIKCCVVWRIGVSPLFVGQDIIETGNGAEKLFGAEIKY